MSLKDPCDAELHPRAVDGIRLFNMGDYFEAHEAFEDAWREENTPIRELYRGILQIAVVYLHITRNNYPGAVKVYGRSQKWLKDWPRHCRGINVEQLRKDLETVIVEVRRLGPDQLSTFERAFLKPIESDYDLA